MRLDALLELVVDRAQLQIVLHGLEGGLDLDELDVEPPQLGRVFAGERACAIAGRGSPAADPETGAAYEYRPKSGAAYELCADFFEASSDEGSRVRYGYQSNFWEHGKGRTCFSLDVAKTIPY